jgi:hypothetical protein
MGTSVKGNDMQEAEYVGPAPVFKEPSNQYLGCVDYPPDELTLREIAERARRGAREQAAVALPIRADIATLISLALFTYPKTSKDERDRLERIAVWFYERGVERGMSIGKGEL